MYSVLIADDELAVCKGLQVLIRWRDYGFNVEGIASNGKEALKIIENKKIDLLITDIRMPGMDGLELIKSIRESNINIKIIILSAYRDFDYAKSAIKYNVQDFLLKPVEEFEVIDILKKLQNDITEEQDKMNSLEKSREYIQDELLHNLVQDNHNPGLLLELNKLGIYLDSKFMYISIVHFSGGGSDKNNYFIIKGISEILQNYCDSYIFRDEFKRICILNTYNNKNLSYKEKFEQKIYLEISTKFPGKTVIAVGDKADSAFGLKESYNHASKALQWMLFQDKSGLVYFQTIPWCMSPDNTTIDKKMEDLKQFIKLRSKEICERLIEELITYMSYNNYTIEFIYSVCARILILINELGMDMGVQVIKTDEDFSVNMLYQLSGNEIKKFLIKACNFLCDSSGNNPNLIMGSNQLINEVIAYINQSYQQDLSLKKLSNQFHINNAYLGRLFYKTTGKNFTDYLNDCRVNNAANMLKKSDLKIYEVAYLVGYLDIDYFTKVFKERMGTTPSKFKNNSDDI